MAAASPQIILRVVEQDRARKFKLSSRPASVDAQINIIEEQLDIDLDFYFCFMKIQTSTGNLLPLQTLRNCHKKLLCTSHFHKTPGAGFTKVFLR
ncbi:unnamed protein product [Arctogadus glacialis]